MCSHGQKWEEAKHDTPFSGINYHLLLLLLYQVVSNVILRNDTWLTYVEKNWFKQVPHVSLRSKVIKSITWYDLFYYITYITKITWTRKRENVVVISPFHHSNFYILVNSKLMVVPWVKYQIFWTEGPSCKNKRKEGPVVRIRDVIQMPSCLSSI